MSSVSPRLGLWTRVGWSESVERNASGKHSTNWVTAFLQWILAFCHDATPFSLFVFNIHVHVCMHCWKHNNNLQKYHNLLAICYLVSAEHILFARTQETVTYREDCKHNITLIFFFTAACWFRGLVWWFFLSCQFMQVSLSNFGLRIKGNLLLLQLPAHVVAMWHILIIWYVWKHWVRMAPMCSWHKEVMPLPGHELSELPNYSKFKGTPTPAFDQRIDNIIMSMDACVAHL